MLYVFVCVRENETSNVLEVIGSNVGWGSIPSIHTMHPAAYSAVCHQCRQYATSCSLVWTHYDLKTVGAVLRMHYNAENIRVWRKTLIG